VGAAVEDGFVVVLDPAAALELIGVESFHVPSCW
jgi:hypothetical protein